MISSRHRREMDVAAWAVTCLAIVAGSLARSDEPAVESSSVTEVLALPPATGDERREVCIRGVVTLAFPDRVDFAVQDATGGIWVTAADATDALLRPTLRCGHEVEVRGRLDRGGFAPLLSARDLRILGTAPLPEPLAGDMARLCVGADNCHRVELTGIVQGYRSDPGRQIASIVTEVAARRMVVQLPKGLADLGRRELVDATVRMVGVVGAIRNTRGEFLCPTLWIGRPEDLTIVDPPAADPFEARRVSLGELGRFQLDPPSGHRMQTEGVVTCALAGRRFYLQEGLTGVRVHATSPRQVSVGDRVTVAGFIDMSRQTAGITEAVVRISGTATVPDPRAITPDEIASINTEARRRGMIAEPSNFDGCLVTFPARLIEVLEEKPGTGRLVLSSGRTTLAAQFDGDGFAPLGRLQAGSELEITGVMEVQLLGDEGLRSVASDPVVQQLALLLRTMADVRVVRTPSWWTPARLAAILAGVLAILVGALAWVWLLRREVALQAQQLAREISTRRDAAVEFQAALRERNRLAANLHDTLLQTLTGIHFQLAACRSRGRRAAEDVAEPLDIAQRMVDHAAQELRGSVWALRTMPLVGHSFRESLESLTSHLQKQRPERLTAHVEGRPFDVPNFVAGNLLLVIQEAILNAMHHARAETIDVGVVFDEATGSITAEVRDDGCGFDRATAAGPSQGHFGLQGMRERMERLNGQLAIESRVGGGTTVRAKAFKRDYDAEIDPSGQPDPGTAG